MIQITKEEAFWFLKNTKAKLENGISTSHTKHKKYYLVEKAEYVRLLNERRNAAIVYTRECK